jgi:hypothetical protein
MSKKSEKNRLQEWEGLLAGLREAALRGGRAAPLLAALAGALQEAEEIRDGREIFVAAAKDARKNLTRVLCRGQAAAVTARHYLKFHFGPYNDELVRFGVSPIRRGPSRKARPAGTAASPCGDKAN